jgi:valyl-tRNA synthetase
MSKSKPETTINPMDVIPVYGTDALRLALLSGVSPGNDQRMSIAKITSQRNFCNKLWNIARFVEDKLGDDFVLESHAKATNHADHWLLSKLQQTTDTIASDLENYRFAEAYDKLYHFVWDDFADWYIEASKMELNPQVLAHSLQSILIIAHPFAPFITETIWQTLAWQGDSMLAVAPWPATVKTNPNDAKVFDEIIVVVTEVRSLMTELNLHGSKLYYHNVPFLKENAELIKKLTKLKDVIDVEAGLGLQLVQTKYKAWLDVDSSTIKAHQLQLKEQQGRLGDVVKSLEARLANKNYVKQAPKAIVDQTKDQLAENKQLLEKIAAQQARFAAGS